MSWAVITTATTTSTVACVFTWQLALIENVSAPRHIFVALQSLYRTQINPAVANDHLQLRSHMIFDQCDVSEVSLRISNQQEPADNLILDYGNNQVGRVYHRLWSYMGRDQNVDTPAAGGFRAIAVILSDKSMILEGGGGKMRVIDAPIENM